MTTLLIIFLIVVLIIPMICALIGAMFGLFILYALICFGIMRLQEIINAYRKRKVIDYKHTQ